MAQPRVAEAEAKRSEEPVPVKEGPNVEEYLAVPATTTSYHLAEGRLATSPAPILDRKPVGAISRACDGLARANGGEGVVWAADCQLPVAPVQEPDPGDLPPALAGIIERWVVGAPGVVVEVPPAGARRFARVAKLRACRKAGRREACLVDPGSQTVMVFTGDGNSWRKERRVLFGDPVPSMPVAHVSAGLERFA